MKRKCPNLLKPLDTIIQENNQPFYPSEPFRFTRFNMRHPVLTLKALIRTRLAQKLRQFLAQFSCPLLLEFPNSWCTMQQGIKPSCFLEIRRWSMLKRGKKTVKNKWEKLGHMYMQSHFWHPIYNTKLCWKYEKLTKISYSYPALLHKYGIISKNLHREKFKTQGIGNWKNCHKWWIH